MTLAFGSTTLAVSTILTVFMGGLALGSWLGGRWVDRWVNPLTKYGLVEILLAEYALLTPLLFKAVFPLFDSLGSKVSDDLYLLSVIRFVATGVLLLPPTALMGATFPILARYSLLNWPDRGRGPGLLYGFNTLGAFLGTLAAGFIFLPRLGLVGTILLGGGCNLALGIVAFCVGRQIERGREAEATSSGPENATTATQKGSHVPVLAAVALTGFAGMVCEVGWTRVLTLVLGASVYAFTIMLSTFLAGLGLGAAIVAACLKGVSLPRARGLFYGLAVASAASVCLSMAGFAHLPELFWRLFWEWNLLKNPGHILRIEFVMAGLVMALPTLLMGGLFPAAVRLVVEEAGQAGRRVAGVYAWNTAGAILGSFTAGFLLIPILGIRGTLLAASACQAAAAMAIALGSAARLRNLFLAGVAASVPVLAVLWMPPWQRQVMTCGMYHYAKSYRGISPGGLKATLEADEEIFFYRDGLTATVTVGRTRSAARDDIYISVNGKIDGSSYYDMPTQRLSAHIPILFHSRPEEVCIVGLGTGCTAGSAALHPVRRVTVVEIEAAMVEGARRFEKANHRVHDNPKVDIRVTDGRLFLRLHPGAFDVVISEPSNPWQAGNADLFTVEFFRLGARALRPGGIFCQWVHLYGLTPANVRTLVRTFAEVFPHAYVISTIKDTDILLLGGEGALTLDLARAWGSMAAAKSVADDMADPRVGVRSLFDLLARFRMGPRDLREFAGAGPLHTDDLPLIAYRAPFDLYLETRGANMRLLALHANGIAPYLEDLTGIPMPPRAFFEMLAKSYDQFLPYGREAVVCQEWAAQATEIP